MKTIMLCSSVNSVLDRWQEILKEGYVIERTSSASQLADFLSENKVDMILLHRATLDKQTVVAILANDPSIKIFMFADRPDEQEGLTFLQIGVVGYASTYMAPKWLQEAIRITLTGRVWVGQKLMQRLIQVTAAGGGIKQNNAFVTKLSEREREVAELVAAGMTNLAIAFELDIAERTVKGHISSIFQKTGTDSRLKLALLMRGIAT